MRGKCLHPRKAGWIGIIMWGRQLGITQMILINPEPQLQPFEFQRTKLRLDCNVFQPSAINIQSNSSGL